MTRFYHLSPLLLANLPDYLFEPLVEHMTAIEAEEFEMQLIAALAPFQKPEKLRRLTGRIRSVIVPARPVPSEPIEHDPEKAAAWFEELGAKVSKKVQ